MTATSVGTAMPRWNKTDRAAIAIVALAQKMAENGRPFASRSSQHRRPPTAREIAFEDQVLGDRQADPAPFLKKSRMALVRVQSIQGAGNDGNVPVANLDQRPRGHAPAFDVIARETLAFEGRHHPGS